MNGYTEEGFEEWAREEIEQMPPILDMIAMERELDIEHIDEIKIVDNDKAWAYYHELKARLDQHQRKTA